MIHVMDVNFEQAKKFFETGVGHYEAGRYAQAEAQFAAALALMPGRVSVLTNLGAARLKLGKLQEAAELLDEALVKEPDNVEALGHRATVMAEMGHKQAALELISRAVQLAPSLGPAWTLRGTLLRELGHALEAAVSFRNAIENGGDRELNRYYLAAVGAGEPPRAAPRKYVQSLFEGYAEGFDDHLVHVLKYRAPEILAEGLRRIKPEYEAVLDLGCGTGLCGPLLRPLARRLEGIDLSQNMVERATARKVYDSVIQADLVEYLSSTDRRYDAIVAADVFIYVGALEEVFMGVSRVIETGGVFCFSVEEAAAGRELELHPSLRYAHSRGYIQSLAARNGFEIVHTEAHPIREDQQAPIPGLYAWLVKS